eukprot:g13094.t1
MGLNTFTAAVLLVAGAIQADAFAMGPVTAGRNTVTMSSLSKVNAPSARGDVFKLNLSPYEEYMASRGQTVSAPAAPAAPAPAPAAPAAAPARARSTSKWSPRPDWKSGKPGRARVSSPTAVSRPSAPAAPAYTPPPAYSPPAPAAPAASYAAPGKTADGHIGSGGMADTRDPAPVDHEDPRKSISAAPSFEEYLKSKRN